MKRRLAALIVFAAAISVAAPGETSGASAGRDKAARKKSAQRAARGVSLTGCIDEKDGQYVLAEPGTLRTIAALQADSFPQEGFAKHLGHTVTVRGAAPPAGDPPLFKVRSVEKVSDLCGAPQEAR